MGAQALARLHGVEEPTFVHPDKAFARGRSVAQASDGEAVFAVYTWRRNLDSVTPFTLGSYAHAMCTAENVPRRYIAPNSGEPHQTELGSETVRTWEAQVGVQAGLRGYRASVYSSTCHVVARTFWRPLSTVRSQRWACSLQERLVAVSSTPGQLVSSITLALGIRFPASTRGTYNALRHFNTFFR